MEMEYEMIEDKVLDNVIELSPTDYEKFCVNILRNQMTPGFTSAESLIVEHHKIIKKDEQKYEFDIYCQFTVGNMATIKMAGECKRHSNKVPREKLQAFRQKMTDAGIHKGIFFSTSGFQSGAITYAKNNGIALCQLTSENDMNIITHSIEKKAISVIGAWVYEEDGKHVCRPAMPEVTNRFVDWAIDKEIFR